MSFPAKNYTLGKGRLYFDKFANISTKALSGERYFGNTPEFSLSSDSNNLDHYDSDAGVKVKDASVLLELNRTGSFVTDHISPDNLALFFLGSAAVLSQASATASTSAFADVSHGLYYQLGRTTARPEGVRNVSNVVVKDSTNTTTFTVNTDYTVDAVNGRIYIVVGGTIPALSDINVTFDVAATSIDRVVTAASAEVYGALRFIATNPQGEKFNYFFPYVAIRPNGDFALKGEEWQQIGFNIEVLKLDDNTEAMYVDHIA